MRGLTKEERLVLLLSRPVLSSKEIDTCRGMIRDGVDWNIFLRKCDIARTSPIVYRNIKSLDMPEDIEDKLRLRYLGSLRHNLLLKDELKGILSSLNKKGIDAIPLKGPIASEQIFGDIALYTGSDMDLLVRPSDIEEAKRVLIEMGYSEVGGITEEDYIKTNYHLPPYGKNGFYVELHWNLTMRYFHSSPDFWWDEVGEIEYDKERFLCLSPERYILYAIFRLFSHAFYPLKFHVLLAGLIDFYRERIDSDALSLMAKKIGMERLLGFALSMMRDFFDIDIPLRFKGDGILMNRIKDMILKGLFDEEPVLTRRMIIYSYLQESLKGYLSLLMRRLFPSQAEIRSRYGIKPGSKRLIFYYLMNPFYLFFGKR